MADASGAAARDVRAELEALGAPRRLVRTADVKLMLAETAERPFSDPAWVFELKYDGYRVLAAREDGRPRLVYRKGSDATAIYPDIARALEALASVDLVIDGSPGDTALDFQAGPACRGLNLPQDQIGFPVQGQNLLQIFKLRLQGIHFLLKLIENGLLLLTLFDVRCKVGELRCLPVNFQLNRRQENVIDASQQNATHHSNDQDLNMPFQF